MYFVKNIINNGIELKMENFVEIKIERYLSSETIIVIVLLLLTLCYVY